jgi:hypothetical protein
VNNCNKFQCRKALWVITNFQEQRARDHAVAVAAVFETLTSNMVRISNIVFSHEFLDSFLKLNDTKTRADHESGEIPKAFWKEVAEAMNASSDDDGTALQVVIAEDDNHYEEIMSIELQQFDTMSDSAIRKKVQSLFKVRKEIKKNMSQSGEHDNDPYNFVDVAMKKVRGPGLTKLGCYYFFKRCDQNPEVDTTFAEGMDENLKGNTDDILISSKITASNEKKQAHWRRNEADQQAGRAVQPAGGAVEQACKTVTVHLSCSAPGKAGDS